MAFFRRPKNPYGVAILKADPEKHFYTVYTYKEDQYTRSFYCNCHLAKLKYNLNQLSSH